MSANKFRLQPPTITATTTTYSNIKKVWMNFVFILSLCFFLVRFSSLSRSVTNSINNNSCERVWNCVSVFRSLLCFLFRFVKILNVCVCVRVRLNFKLKEKRKNFISLKNFLAFYFFFNLLLVVASLVTFCCCSHKHTHSDKFILSVCKCTTVNCRFYIDFYPVFCLR